MRRSGTSSGEGTPAGIKVYAASYAVSYPVSYDEVDALAEFAKHHDITYPLLADKGSKVIRSYGIQSHFIKKEHVPYYRVPFPGTYLVDEEGVVTRKFFSHLSRGRRQSQVRRHPRDDRTL